jgi:hypothetical protein
LDSFIREMFFVCQDVLAILLQFFFQVCNVIFIIQHQERHRGGFDENVDEKQSKAKQRGSRDHSRNVGECNPIKQRESLMMEFVF